LDEGQLVGARLTVQSEQFPADRPYPYIDQIDFSSGFQGFVFEFSVQRTSVRRIPSHQQPVSLPEKTYARKPSAGISIAVSSVYIDYSMPGGYVSRLICEGLIKPGGSGQDHLKGAECSIEFSEYDLEDGRYPKESLSGEFRWNKGTRSFSVGLRYRQVDLAGPLASLIFAGTSDWVHIEMTLLTDIAESKLGDLHGEISYWRVHTFQKLGLQRKINVLGEIAIGIYASVFTSSVLLFLAIVGLRGFALAAAVALSPFATAVIYATLRKALNKDITPR